VNASTTPRVLSGGMSWTEALTVLLSTPRAHSWLNSARKPLPLVMKQCKSLRIIQNKQRKESFCMCVGVVLEKNCAEFLDKWAGLPCEMRRTASRFQNTVSMHAFGPSTKEVQLDSERVRGRNGDWPTCK
jgi:hypothetical protein